MEYNTIQYNTIQYNTIQYNTIQYNTIQYNTIQYNTIQYNTIQYNTCLENKCASEGRNYQQQQHDSKVMGFTQEVSDGFCTTARNVAKFEWPRAPVSEGKQRLNTSF